MDLNKEQNMSKWFEEKIRTLTALQTTTAKILLKEKGKDAVIKYLKSLDDQNVSRI